MQSFLERLRERKVIQWALAYVAGAAVVLELLSSVADPWGIPFALIRSIQALVALGLLVTVVLAWYHGEAGPQHVGGTELLVLAALLATAGLVMALAQVPSGRAGPPTETTEVRVPVVGVLPAEDHAGARAGSGWTAVLQRLMSAELARPRGVAVMDDLSLNTLLEGAEPGGRETYDRLRRAGVDYVVRQATQEVTAGVEVTYQLTDARTGHLVASGSFINTAEGNITAQVRQAANAIIADLEDLSGGITKALDLEPWLARPPADIDATRAFLQGTEYAYRGVPGGRSHYERALAIDPEFIAPRIWLVSSLVSAGDTAEAREHVRVLRSLERGGTPFEQAMIGWAEALARWDMTGMVRHLEAALSYSPRNNVLLYNLGFTLRLLDRPAEALAPLRRAVDARWHYPDLYPLYALTAIEVGEVDGLRATLEDALTLGVHGPTTYRILEALALFQGDPVAARRHGATLRRFDESAPELGEILPVYRSLAQIARDRGNPETGVILLQMATTAVPGRADVRLELARALGELGAVSAAEQHYTESLRSGSPSPATIYLLGEVASLIGRNDEAATHFARYLELAPDGPDAIRAREHLGSLRAALQPR